MLVEKSINNNIVSCRDDSGCELIVMGRGLGFQCKPGTQIRPELIEKVFHLEDPQQIDRFKDLVRDIPSVYLQLCTRIVDYAADFLNTHLRESIYLTLTDHIYFSVGQLQKGLSFHNALEYEIRTFYPQEYAAGCHALSMIRDELGVSLPDDEAASIALHLVNAESDGFLQDTLRTTRVLHDILDLLIERLSFQPGDPYYDELAVLIKFLVQRSFSNAPCPPDDPLLTQLIRTHCPDAFSIAQDIVHRLEQSCGHKIPAVETACLAVHIRRAHHSADLA